MEDWKLFIFIFCKIDITLAHLSSAYSLSLQGGKSSFPSIFINGCQGYVSGGLLRDTTNQILIYIKMVRFEKYITDQVNKGLNFNPIYFFMNWHGYETISTHTTFQEIPCMTITTTSLLFSTVENQLMCKLFCLEQTQIL